jgi:hypothetical protein
MIVDVFIVKHISSSSVSFCELGQRIDRRAPLPWVGVCPKGDLMAAIAVDFHREPAAVCERLGFSYRHVEYIDANEEHYTPNHVLGFGTPPFGWIKLFHAAWANPSGPPRRNETTAAAAP